MKGELRFVFHIFYVGLWVVAMLVLDIAQRDDSH